MTAERDSSSLFRALADDTRRRILQLLGQGPLTSGEIADRFDSSWPTISRHLAILRESGLVRAERNGQEIHYELNTSVFQDLVRHLMEWVEPSHRATKPRTRRQRAEEF
jgi:ArsR family transcriptional regulator, repressor of sdpIR and other operons